MDLEALKYPIGKFSFPKEVNENDVSEWILKIELLPEKLIQEVETLSEDKLDTPYRPQGWTIRQVIHHIADSHLNSYIRFKWALTEDQPTIKDYNEADWANFPDASTSPVDISTSLISALHRRWVVMLKNLTSEQLLKKFVPPQTGRPIRLDHNISLYAWHGEHHLAQIIQTKVNNRW